MFLGLVATNYLAVLQVIFIFVIPPPPPGGPGEGPDCNFPKEIVGFGPIPARIRGFVILMLALSTARTISARSGLRSWCPGVAGGRGASTSHGRCRRPMAVKHAVR